MHMNSECISHFPCLALKARNEYVLFLPSLHLCTFMQGKKQLTELGIPGKGNYTYKIMEV